MKRPLSWLGALLDGAFIIVLGCSVTGALVITYHLITSWRSSWRIW